jgi:hypothetical protein
MARTLIEFIADKINKTANAQPPTKAAAAGGMMPSTNNSGAGMVGLYYSYVEGEQSKNAMSMSDGEPCARSYGVSPRLHVAKNVFGIVER